MADERVNVRILFKESGREEYYQMSQQERDKLTSAFCSGNEQNPLRYGRYTTYYGSEERTLALRFGDVLFIG